MKLGLVGLPGAGKSTIFEALTKISTEEAKMRGEPSIGTIRVPDERVDFLSGMYKPKKTTYAQVEYFLPHLTGSAADKKQAESAWTGVRNCDALLHVVRNFTSFENAPAPWEDFSSLEQEMIFTDLVIVEKRLERLALDGKRGRKADPEEVSLLEKCRKLLEEEKPLRRDKEIAAAKVLRGYGFLSAKPVLVICNNEENDDVLPAEPFREQENRMAVRGSLERDLASMGPEEAQEFLAEYGVATSAMDRVIGASYELLGLISFFTVGEDEVKAWTLRQGTAAVEAAGQIHSDIQKGFIRAEVLAFDDLRGAGSYKEARKRGTVRLEGKTYRVQDGDIIEFRFNV